MYLANEPTLNDLEEAARRYPYVWTLLAQGLTTRLADGIIRDLSPDIVGSGFFSEVTVAIGEYDLAEVIPLAADPPPIHYYGRSLLAFELHSDGYPTEGAMFRREIFEVPEFQTLENSLEAIMGPVKRCLYWQA